MYSVVVLTRQNNFEKKTTCGVLRFNTSRRWDQVMEFCFQSLALSLVLLQPFPCFWQVVYRLQFFSVNFVVEVAHFTYFWLQQECRKLVITIKSFFQCEYHLNLIPAMLLATFTTRNERNKERMSLENRGTAQENWTVRTQRKFKHR